MHEHKTAIRWPLNFTHAEVIIQGTTPEGIEIELAVHRVVFKDPGDAALIEVQDTDPINSRRFLEHNRQGYMLDLRGTMVPIDGDPSQALYTAKVDQPEDLRRAVAGEGPSADDLLPAGWTDPSDWS